MLFLISAEWNEESDLDTLFDQFALVNSVFDSF